MFHLGRGENVIREFSLKNLNFWSIEALVRTLGQNANVHLKRMRDERLTKMSNIIRCLRYSHTHLRVNKFCALLSSSHDRIRRLIQIVYPTLWSPLSSVKMVSVLEHRRPKNIQSISQMVPEYWSGDQLEIIPNNQHRKSPNTINLMNWKTAPFKRARPRNILFDVTIQNYFFAVICLPVYNSTTKKKDFLFTYTRSIPLHHRNK